MGQDQTRYTHGREERWGIITRTLSTFSGTDEAPDVTPATLQIASGGKYYYAHFTEEEIAARTAQGNRPRSHSDWRTQTLPRCGPRSVLVEEMPTPFRKDGPPVPWDTDWLIGPGQRGPCGQDTGESCQCLQGQTEKGRDALKTWFLPRPSPCPPPATLSHDKPPARGSQFGSHGWGCPQRGQGAVGTGGCRSHQRPQNRLSLGLGPEGRLYLGAPTLGPHMPITPWAQSYKRRDWTPPAQGEPSAARGA